MPANDGLQWRTFQDFTGGLYEKGSDHDVPENGLAALTDGQPLVNGGLRASFRWTTHVNTSQAGSSAGIPTSTAYNLMGFYVAHNGQSVTPHRVYLLTAPATLPGGTTNTRVFGSSSTASTAAWSFSTIAHHSDTTAYVPVRFVLYSYVSGGAVVTNEHYHLAESTSTSIGVWRLHPAGSGSTRITTGNFHIYHLEAHQNRLVAVSDRVGGPGPILYRQQLGFSDDGSSAGINASSNRVTLGAWHPSDIACMYSRMPNDLAILKAQAGWFQVTGAMAANPVTFEVTRVHGSQQISFAAETPSGLAYLTEDEGVWAFTGGIQPQFLSPQFTGTPQTEIVMANALGNGPGFLGQPAYAGSYLFTPKGYVLDFNQRAWFKVSALNQSPPFAWLQYEKVSGRIFAARHTEAGGLQILSASINEATMDRSTSYTFEVPLWARPGGTVQLSEVELGVQSRQSGSRVLMQVVAPTPSGGESTWVHPPVILQGAHFEAFRLRVDGSVANAPWVRLRFTMSASSAEAPTLAFLRAAWRPGTPYLVR